MFDRARPPSWDEAIYLSQVAPDHEALLFASSRSRGTTLLVAPALWAGASLATTRLVLAAVSGGALLWAFGLWVPVIGLGAVGAAFAFGISWVGLLYGSEVMPNLWTALGAVATLGVVARLVSGDPVVAGRTTVAGLLAVTALFRPLDAVVFGVAVCLGLVVMRRADRRLLLALVVGPVVGALPWLMENTVRLGDPATALRAAATVGHVSGGAPVDAALQYLALADGPLLGPQADVTIPLVGTVWLVGVVALASVAFIRGRQERHHPAIVLAGLAGLSLTAEYVFVVEGVAPRFLLPAYAMLSIAAGVGLVHLSSRRGGAPAAIALTAVAVIAWVGWQSATAVRLETAAAAERRVPERVGTVLAGLAQGDPCAFASSDSFPQISWASGCRGRPLRGAGVVSTIVQQDRRSFLVVRGPAPTWAILDGIGAFSVSAGRARWHIFELAPPGTAIVESQNDRLTPSPATP